MNRRTFFRISAAATGGFLIAMYFDFPTSAQEAAPKIYPPDAFVHIKPNGEVVIMVNRVEVGQGTSTALPMILAEELDADWSKVIAEIAPAADVYRDPVVGMQMLGGSISIANSYQQYRELGARTRAMLIAAAADRWHVTPEQCRTANSVAYGPAGQKASYAELAEDATRRPIPEKVRLKDPSEFRLIGKPMRRLDGRAKSNGSQQFGIDLDFPGMKIALLARPPVFFGRVRRFDDSEARKIAGVADVFEIPLAKGKGSAVAVVADRFWAAKQARDRLIIDWDLSGVEHADTIELRKRFNELARTTGRIAATRGDAKAMEGIATDNRIVAEYDFPYLAHAPMEPLNITLRYDGDRAEAWTTSQVPDTQRQAMAEVLGLPADRVTYHIGFAGGAFGRRGTLDEHLEREVAAIARRMRGVPIKLIWTREDDVQGGYYRPMVAHRVEVGVGDDGMPSSWRHVVVGQGIVLGTPFESFYAKDGIEALLIEGTADTRYAIPNFHVSVHHPAVNVPVLSWRSVGYSHNTFVVETLIEELALRANVDPIAYRLKLLDPSAKRQRAVLTLLNEKSGWRNALPPNHACGIALSEYHETASACAADVSIEDGRPRIHRVSVTVACGLAVNPMTIENQFQGGLAFGVTQLMAKGAITLKDGRVEQRNLDGYTPPYIKDAPVAVDVHIVPSAEPPTAIGECPVPLIAPAVVNALARLTGKHYRSLPLVEL
ncbi:MAG TPA: molybdopterin cofactor-binding domain-containing protein [Thermoanaerobaculia bacterium]|nr:molybdopterin cofactor-binding domain-containing protein [Thermoanaerobaculia bacterium]